MIYIRMVEFLRSKTTNEERAQCYQSARIGQTAYSAFHPSSSLIALHFLKVLKHIMNFEVLRAVR